MKKEYTKPLIEEIELNVEDVLALSMPAFKDAFNWGGDVVDEIF